MHQAQRVDGHVREVTVAVIEECKKVPKESFWQKVKGEWRKLEAKVKKSQ